MNVDHAKQVLDHQGKHVTIIQEILERIISIENRLARFELQSKGKMDDFLRGQQALTVRFDRLDHIIQKQEHSK